jgi:hypothetical protein
MAYVVRVRPFKKFEICYKLGLHPNALLHLRGSESLTPSASLRFRQVREGTLFNNERLHTCMEFAASGRNQTCPDPRGIYQRISAVDDRCTILYASVLTSMYSASLLPKLSIDSGGLNKPHDAE